MPKEKLAIAVADREATQSQAEAASLFAKFSSLNGCSFRPGW